MRIYVRILGISAVPYETNAARIRARLLREGWENVGGARHDKFRKAGRPAIMVLRHRTLTPGVAESIAKAAGWTKQETPGEQVCRSD